MGLAMRWSQVLFTQGFGTRRECAGLLGGGYLRHAGMVVDEDADVDTDGLEFEVEGRTWPFHETALILLHKPAGYECSQEAASTTPACCCCCRRPCATRGVQPVGRLDEDTTGLLLLTDDGTLIHRLTSPKHHVPKVYEVQTARHELDDTQVQRLLDGVVLDDDPAPVRAAALRGRRPEPHCG
jgi:16S rRNA pseudouridine516 synthase